MANKKANYEYKIVHLPKYLTSSEAVLAEWNEDMWELVMLFNADPKFDDIEETNNPFGDSLKDSTLFAIFKRSLN